MWSRIALASLTSTIRYAARPTPRRAKSSPLRIEKLDDRCVPAFLAPVDYSVGSLPRAVAVGHFDAGGTLDLVVANTLSNSVSVLLGNGDGTFQAARNSAAGSEPFSLATGDLDNDGKMDVVAMDRYEISVLRGNGDGTFEAPMTFGVFDKPLSVAVGDFDADGNLDLGVMTTRHYQGYYDSADVGLVNILLGHGDGSFTHYSQTHLDTGWPTSAAVGDIDGDGNLDLVAGDSGFPTFTSVLLGDGHGGFRSLSDVDAGLEAHGLVHLGDVNGDGNLDLVTASGTDVGVLLGDGTGAFGTAARYVVPPYVQSLDLADFNADGHIDVVTANHPWNGSNVRGSVSVLIGKGDGSFNPALITTTDSLPTSVAAGDFNGDGLADAVTAIPQVSGTVSVLLNAGDFPVADAPSVRIGDATVSEGNTGTRVATFSVSLSAAPTSPVAVTFTTVDGTATTADGDYVAKSGTLTFSPGSPLTQTVAVTINSDRRGEPDESFTVNLTGVTNGYIADASGVGTITDDEPRISIGNAATAEGHRGTKLLTFTVTLSRAYDAPVTVDFATADFDATVADNDYVAKSGTLTFDPGQTTRTIAITIIGDKKREFDEYFFVSLSNATNALLLDTGATGRIINDDNGGGSGGRGSRLLAGALSVNGDWWDIGANGHRKRR